MIFPEDSLEQNKKLVSLWNSFIISQQQACDKKVVMQVSSRLVRVTKISLSLRLK